MTAKELATYERLGMKFATQTATKAQILRYLELKRKKEHAAKKEPA